MNTKQMLHQLLEDMPESKLRKVADFAAFLNWQDEREEWRQFGQSQLARAYGPDEPEYTLQDVKQENPS